MNIGSGGYENLEKNVYTFHSHCVHLQNARGLLVGIYMILLRDIELAN